VTSFITPVPGFPTFIATNASVDPRRPAVICGDGSRTWGTFHATTNRVANALISAGVVRGDRVATVMHNSIEAFEVLWGVVKAGAVVMPLSYMSSAETLRTQLNHAQASLIICDQVGVELVEQTAGLDLPTHRRAGYGERLPAGWTDAKAMFAGAPDCDPGVAVDPAAPMSLLYTSGTTGEPKGIEHTQAARVNFATDYAMCLHIDRQTVSISSTPLYTNGTWTTMLPTVAAGGTVVLVEKFEPNLLLQLIERHRVTHAFLVPTQLGRLMKVADASHHAVDSLQTVLTGAAPMTAELLDEVARAWPQTRVCENWGCTEGFSTFVSPVEREGRGATVGRPMRGTEVKAIGPDGVEVEPGQVGELVGWGGALMNGYYRNPLKSAELVWASPDGRTFVRSGDLGHVDDNGFVFLSGRVKDMILSGGINVFPADIEEVIGRHDDVLEVVVIGVPHPDWGETPLALVRLRDGADVEAEELRDWANSRLGKYQRVHAVEIRQDFPRTSYSKVLRRDLRDAYWVGSGGNDPS
jgi:acyl-CoA synthetase (AMP-forming)/AMP-acid ligase II